jgi:hypothetical protein
LSKISFDKLPRDWLSLYRRWKHGDWRSNRSGTLDLYSTNETKSLLKLCAK